MSNRLPTLGDRVKDRVSGLTGIVTATSQNLAGCDRFYITPPVGADGKLIDGAWVDIDLLEIVEPNAIERIVYTRKAPGGIDLPPPR